MAQLAEPLHPRFIPDCPYAGLGYYTEQYADVFFGRDAERKKIIGNLRASRLTLLYAESGVGKSSLLRAGVAARLHELAYENVGERGTARYVPVVFSSWRDEPRERLIAEIESAIAPFLPAGTTVELPRDALDAAIATATEAVGATLLVILDQFEDYLLYRSEEARLADELAWCINSSELRANFLIAIREDAYAGLGDLFKGRLSNVYGNYLHLEYLDKVAAREAIEKPIERFNEAHPDDEPILIGPGLVDDVLEQVARGKIVIGEAGRGTLDGAEPGDSRYVETPYLQLVMRRLWDTERTAGSRTLRAETLHALGGAETIIRDHLERALSDFSDDQRQELAAAFKFLVTPSGTKIALSARDLAQFADVPEADLAEELEKLAGDVRILRPIAPVRSGDPTRYEIYHDSLAPAFLSWHRIQSEKQLQVRAEQERDAARRDREAALEQARRERKRAMVLWVLLGIAVVGLVAAVAAGGWAFEQRKSARAQARTARSEALAAQALAELPLDPDASVRFALAALATRQTPQAQEALRTAVPASHLRAIQREDDFVSSVAFSPDGRSVALGTARGTLIDTLRATRFRTVAKFSKANGWTSSSQFSPDGSLLVTADNGGAAIWNVAQCTQRPSRCQPVHRFRMPSAEAAAFDPAGKRVVTVGWDGTAIRAQVWDVATCVARRACNPLALPTRTPPVSAALGPRGFAAVLDQSGMVHVWRLRGRHAQPVTTLALGGTQTANVVFDANSRRPLLAAAVDYSVRVWDAQACARAAAAKRRCAPLRTIAEPDFVHSVSFSPNGRYLAVPTEDGTTSIWTVVPNAEPALVLHGDPAAVLAVAFSPDGRRVVTGSADRTARLWDVSSGTELELGSTSLADAEFDPVGDRIATAAGGTISLWTADGRRLASYVVGRPITAGVLPNARTYVVASTSSDGTSTVAATTCADGRCRLRRVATIATWTDGLAAAPNGRLVAAAGDDGVVRLVDLTRRKVIAERAASAGKQLFAVDFSADGHYLLTAGTDGAVRIWDVSGCRPSGCTIRSMGRTLPHKVAPIYAAVFSPDRQSRLVLTGAGNGDVQVWDWRAGTPPHRLRGLTNLVRSVAFSPHLRYVASVGADHNILIWSLTTYRIVAVLPVQAGTQTVAFSPRSDTTLLTASTDGTAHIFRCTTCVSLNRLKQEASDLERAIHPGERP